MRGIMKTVKSLEGSGLLIKVAGEPTENETERTKAFIYLYVIYFRY